MSCCLLHRPWKNYGIEIHMSHSERAERRTERRTKRQYTFTLTHIGTISITISYLSWNLWGSVRWGAPPGELTWAEGDGVDEGSRHLLRRPLVPQGEVVSVKHALRVLGCQDVSVRVWQQGELVRLSQEKQGQSSALQTLQTQLTILQQRKVRTESKSHMYTHTLTHTHRQRKWLLEEHCPSYVSSPSSQEVYGMFSRINRTQWSK